MGRERKRMRNRKIDRRKRTREGEIVRWMEGMEERGKVSKKARKKYGG